MAYIKGNKRFHCKSCCKRSLLDDSEEKPTKCICGGLIILQYLYTIDGVKTRWLHRDGELKIGATEHCFDKMPNGFNCSCPKAKPKLESESSFKAGVSLQPDKSQEPRPSAFRGQRKPTSKLERARLER